LHNDLGRLDVQLFAETARIWAGGQAALCWMAPTCGRVLIAEEDGSIYSCDHFVDPDHRLGSLLTDNLGTLANRPEQITFGESKQTALTAECKRCPWLACCNGGCLKDRFGVSEDGEKGQYYLCAGLKAFFAHAHQPMLKAMELSRQGLSPIEIMARL
ncbi:MAG: SPASM domain-containing protein, partial [Oscillospiraceae bacterium]|nr:SPASM domain-containing protein [Oscillospiraceae bacterium]